MSKVCYIHQEELPCRQCGAETMRNFFPSTNPAAQRNARIGARWDELTAAGKHGHYETLFQLVREEVERTSAMLLEALEAFPEEPNPYTYRMARLKAQCLIAVAKAEGKL